MYLHSKNYEIRYTDVDRNDTLKLSSLLGMLQESACLSADELKFGYKDITPHNIAFIITNWYVTLKKSIKLGQIVRVETWPIAPKRLIVMRDFRVYADDEMVGLVTTRWCMVDINSFKLLPITAFFAEDWREYNDFRSIDFNSWKIPTIESQECVYSKIISNSDYDHYNHVNNTKYADFAMDALTEEEQVGILSTQISYIKQCKLGENLQMFKCRQEDGSLNVEGRVDNEVRVQFLYRYDV